MLAAAGARVTTLDNSPKQLERDREVAEREGLTLETVLGDMRNLSMFETGQYDIILHPCSNGFIDDVRAVWRECARVLVTGGRLIAGFSNPLLFIFDYGELEHGRMKVVHSIPYSDIDSLTESEQEALRAEAEPIMFGHTLEDQLAGQMEAGFHLTGMFEDRVEEGPDAVVGRHIATYIATCATRVA